MWPKAKFDKKLIFRISFGKIFKNKLHHVKVQAETYTIGFRPHSTRKEELPYKTPSFLLAVKGLTILNLQNVSPKTFLEIWPSINNCFFPREISQKLGTNKGSKRGWWRHVASVDLLGLRFWWKILVELSDVFDCKKGIMKQMKIVKMVGELSPTTILSFCRHLVKEN